jgi:serine/threonine protein kinase
LTLACRVEQEADQRGSAPAVYALGALLYHVLAGRPPYLAPTSDAVLALVAAGPPEPLRGLAPDAPSDLIAIAERAMARDPAARFRTAAEMADELKRFQTGQLVTSHHYTLGELARR